MCGGRKVHKFLGALARVRRGGEGYRSFWGHWLECVGWGKGTGVSEGTGQSVWNGW
jgi:hypothetical protein